MVRTRLGTLEVTSKDKKISLTELREKYDVFVQMRRIFFKQDSFKLVNLSQQLSTSENAITYTGDKFTDNAGKIISGSKAIVGLFTEEALRSRPKIEKEEKNTEKIFAILIPKGLFYEVPPPVKRWKDDYKAWFDVLKNLRDTKQIPKSVSINADTISQLSRDKRQVHTHPDQQRVAQNTFLRPTIIWENNKDYFDVFMIDTKFLPIRDKVPLVALPEQTFIYWDNDLGKPVLFYAMLLSIPKKSRNAYITETHIKWDNQVWDKKIIPSFNVLEKTTLVVDKYPKGELQKEAVYILMADPIAINKPFFLQDTRGNKNPRVLVWKRYLDKSDFPASRSVAPKGFDWIQKAPMNNKQLKAWDFNKFLFVSNLIQLKAKQVPMDYVPAKNYKALLIHKAKENDEVSVNSLIRYGLIRGKRNINSPFIRALIGNPIDSARAKNQARLRNLTEAEARKYLEQKLGFFETDVGKQYRISQDPFVAQALKEILKPIEGEYKDLTIEDIKALIKKQKQN